jgi:hypothetical protein
MNTLERLPFGPYTVALDAAHPGHGVIRRADGFPPEPTWYEMQHMARMLWGSHAVAVEVFPRSDNLVDTANMRHLWEVPSAIMAPNLAKGTGWAWPGGSDP